MNHGMVINILGKIMVCMAVLLCVPFMVALIYRESVVGFAVAIGVALIIGLPCSLIKPKSKAIYTKEGFTAVALAWILMSAVGAIPFVVTGSIPRFIDAFFEIVSGFTTTGATILTNVEAMCNSDLFWRSFTHWIGGMGVLVFILAIVPLSDDRSMYLMRAEVPGPTVGKLVPKLKKTAKLLYAIYIVLTVIQVIFLLFGGMSLFDSLIHAFGTAGTGGFSNKTLSLGAYSPYLQYVTAIFMLIFATNFNMHYFVLLGKIKSVFKNEEFRYYWAIVALSTVMIMIGIRNQCANLEEAFRHSFFQVASIISSTGFSSVDFNVWNSLSKTVLVILMLIGACAGSTGGGIKVSRVIITGKGIGNEIRHMLRPRVVTVVKMDGVVIEKNILRSVYMYVIMYIFAIVFSTLLISADGFDFETNVTAVIACMGNTGPGLSLVGPMGSYDMFSWFSKVILSIDMLLGRLEIIPILMLFMPSRM